MNKGSGIEQYRQIKAPAELKARVLSATENTPSKKLLPNILKGYKIVYAMAACLLMLLVGAVVLKNGGTDVNIYVDDTAVLSATSRLTSHVTLVVSSEAELNIETESNNFYLANNGSLETLKTIKNVKNKIEIVWQISEEKDSIRVNGEDYEVSYSEADQKVIVKKIK